MDYEKQYRVEINKYLDCGEENIFFYWKGRVALYALLKAMGVGPEDEVVVQGYTCVVVANAILYLGAKPVYADIDLDTYNYNIESLCSKVSEKTKVIICQNTYGLSSNLEVIERIAREAGEKYGHTVYSIEDCTHGFGGQYHGKSNGISCDASFFSTQWSKPYTTGLGGFCVVHNNVVKDNLARINTDLIQPSTKERAELRLMYVIRKYIINDLTYWPMIRLYRWLSKKNIVVGSSSGEETSGISMPKDFFKAQSSVQFAKGLKALSALDAVNALRKKNARIYTDFLKRHNKRYVSENFFDDHIFIRYPLLVNDREKLKEAAEKAKVTLGEWFEAPVYPAFAPLSTWKVREEEIPTSMYICEHMVNLPTDINNPDKVLEFLEDNIDSVI